MFDNHAPAVTGHDLETIVATSVSHMVEALETHQFPDDNLSATPEGAAFSTFLSAAADLNRAAHSLALDRDLNAEEVRNAVANAEEGVNLLAGLLAAITRRRRN